LWQNDWPYSYSNVGRSPAVERSTSEKTTQLLFYFIWIQLLSFRQHRFFFFEGEAVQSDETKKIIFYYANQKVSHWMRMQRRTQNTQTNRRIQNTQINRISRQTTCERFPPNKL
jgi:hypothetical protein